MRHNFTTEQWLPYPLELAFRFFANPENLPRLMPAWQKARIEEASFAPPPPKSVDNTQIPRLLRGIVAGAGTRMTLSFKPFPLSPIRVPWEAEIDEFAWDDHFCDSQLRGPFAFWHHCHRLKPEIRQTDLGVEIAGTTLTDSVDYELPLGALGDLANRLFIRKQMEGTFRYRHQRTAELLPLMIARTGPAI